MVVNSKWVQPTTCRNAHAWHLFKISSQIYSIKHVYFRAHSCPFKNMQTDLIPRYELLFCCTVVYEPPVFYWQWDCRCSGCGGWALEVHASEQCEGKKEKNVRTNDRSTKSNISFTARDGAVRDRPVAPNRCCIGRDVCRD